MSTVGLRHYLPFIAPLLAAHLVVVALSRRQLIRIGTRAPLAALLPLTILFLAAAYSELYWAFMVTFVGSFAFALAAIVVADGARPTPTRTAIVACLAVASVMCSSVGVGLLVAIGLFVGLRRGYRWAIATVAPAAVAFGGWWIAYGQTGSSQPCGNAPMRLGRAPKLFGFALEKTLSALGSVTPSSILVGSICALGLYSVWRSRTVRTRGAWPVAGAISCVALYALVAVSRSCLLTENGRNPRYAYFGAVLMLPSFALGLQELQRHWPVLRVVIPALLTLVLANNVRKAHADGVCRMTRVDQGRSQLAASLSQSLPANAHPSTVDPEVTIAERDELIRSFDLDLGPPKYALATVQGC